MKIKFTQPYSEALEGFKRGSVHNFIDTAKAQRFIEQGIAVPFEDVTPPEPKPEAAADATPAAGAEPDARPRKKGKP